MTGAGVVTPFVSRCGHICDDLACGELYYGLCSVLWVLLGCGELCRDISENMCVNFRCG